MTTPTVVITDDEDSTSALIEIMGPGMVSFRMTASTLGAGSWIDCKPVWSFGDQSGDYNSLRGFSAAHFWDIEPESDTDYTVRCTVTNVDGETSYAERTVRITPNTRRVVYIDPDTGVASPADPTNPATPYNTVASAVTGESNGSDREYRFAAGKTHIWGSTVGASGATNIICRSTTKGQKFYVTASDSVCLEEATQCCIRDASFLVSGKGSETRMLDPRSSGGGFRMCVIDCESVDPEVSITVGSDTSLSTLVQDTTAADIHSTIFFSGPMMTFLGVSCTHTGNERPWRGAGNLINLYRCTGVYNSTNGKTAFTRHGGDFLWVSECLFQNISSANASNTPVHIGHTSTGPPPTPQYTVIERCRIIQLADLTLTTAMLIAPTTQGVIQCVIRNNYFYGGRLVIGSSNEPTPVDGIHILHNTFVDGDSTKIILQNYWEAVTIRNNLAVGYSNPGSSPEVFRVNNSTLGTLVASDNVWPVSSTVRDVRRDGASTRLTWAEFNALGYGSGNLAKNITLDGQYRPSDVTDTDLLKTPAAGMTQFREDFYGNQRFGQWLCGAVDLVSGKRSHGVGINLGV